MMVIKRKNIHEQPVRVGILGFPGAGKTTLAASFAKHPYCEPCLWLDKRGNPRKIIQDGLIDYALRLDDPGDITYPLDYLTYAVGNPKHPFVEVLQDAYEGKFFDIVPGGEFKSVVLDSATDWQGGILVQHGAEKRIKAQLKNRKTVARVAGQEIELKLQWKDLQPLDFKEDGGDIAKKTIDPLFMLTELPIHTIVTFQLFPDVKVTAVGGGKLAVETVPQVDMYGKVKSRIRAWFDCIPVLEKKEVQVGRTSKMVVVSTFDGRDGLSKDQLFMNEVSQVENLNATKFFNLIEKGKE